MSAPAPVNALDRAWREQAAILFYCYGAGRNDESAQVPATEPPANFDRRAAIEAFDKLDGATRRRWLRFATQQSGRPAFGGR